MTMEDKRRYLVEIEVTTVATHSMYVTADSVAGAVTAAEERVPREYPLPKGAGIAKTEVITIERESDTDYAVRAIRDVNSVSEDPEDSEPTPQTIAIDRGHLQELADSLSVTLATGRLSSELQSGLYESLEMVDQYLGSPRPVVDAGRHNMVDNYLAFRDE